MILNANTISIYQVIKSALDNEGKLIDNTKLPDDDTYYGNGQLKFVGGFFENVMPSGNHRSLAMKIRARKIIASIDRFTMNPTQSNRASMHQLLTNRNSIFSLEYVMRNLTIPNPQMTVLHKLARELLQFSSERNVIKFAIYFLGDNTTKDDIDILLILSRHDDFTMHVIKFTLNRLANANDIIFNIAKHVDGWGKIDSVLNLEPTSDKIRSWLLRNGCSNNIMNSYLAKTCAINGHLVEALRQQTIDHDLFRGAGIILHALHEDIGPNESIDDIEDGSQIVELYLSHADKMVSSLKDLLVIAAIRDWPGHVLNQSIKVFCDKIIAKEHWKSKILDSLDSSSDEIRQIAIQVAEKLGIDVWDRVFNILLEQPLAFSYYLILARTNKTKRFQQLVDFAEKSLPFKEIESGPAKELGLGLEFSAHICLSSIVQFLKNKEGIGTRLIESALWSSVVNNRAMAIQAIKTWRKESWSKLIIERLQILRKIEPEKFLKKEIRELLQ